MNHLPVIYLNRLFRYSHPLFQLIININRIRCLLNSIPTLLLTPILSHRMTYDCSTFVHQMPRYTDPPGKWVAAGTVAVENGEDLWVCGFRQFSWILVSVTSSRDAGLLLHLISRSVQCTCYVDVLGSHYVCGSVPSNREGEAEIESILFLICRFSCCTATHVQGNFCSSSAVLHYHSIRIHSRRMITWPEEYLSRVMQDS